MIHWLTHSSKSIQAFPMGDPHERTFPVYVPDGYDEKRKAPYPVVFFLAGFSGRGSGYISDDSAFEVPLTTRFSLAIAEGRLPPFIGVFPDGTSKLGCSQYVNSPALGNYMDYITLELTDYIDSKYHTYKSGQYRAVVGHSSGGFGALVIAMLRPLSFSYVLSSAADSFYEVSMLSQLNHAMIELEKHKSVTNFINYFLQKPSKKTCSSQEMSTILTLAMAPCYAPNLSNAPLYGDLFFDLKTGAIIDEVWKKYLAWDPLRMIDRHLEALKKIRYLRLESGLQDEFALQWGHRQIAEKLTENNIPFEIEEYQGRHSGHHWRFEERLIRLLNRMTSD